MSQVYRIIACTREDRRMNALKIYRQLKSEGAKVEIFLDHKGYGTEGNHWRAITAPTNATNIVIIEDDAVLCKDFSRRVPLVIGKKRNQIISFYLGTGRPEVYQPIVDRKLEMMDADDEFIELDNLIHGVCYVIPRERVLKMNYAHIDLGSDFRNMGIDFYIGWLNRKIGYRSIWYSVPSLADHLDNEPVTKHPDGEKRDVPRKARILPPDMVR